MTDQPQIYLITPPAPKLSDFGRDLSSVLDATDVACVRMNGAGDDRDDLSRAADLIREICHKRDIPIVIADHVGLVEPLGLDGVHLQDTAKALRSAKKALNDDQILGAHAGLSRHDGLTAGEIGVDYVSFGPVGDTGLGDTEFVDPELFKWWSLMIELPVIAEGGLTLETTRALAPDVDFIALGAEIWRSDDPAAMIKSYADALAI